MYLGSIEIDDNLGGYEMICAPADRLPQDVATGIGKINGGLLGATYQPILYVGRQIVNGTNHLLIAREIRVTQHKNQEIVAIVIHIPNGDTGAKKAKMVKIIEETELPSEAKHAFDSAYADIVGAIYRPLVYVGSQITKGINHYVICSMRVPVPGAQPRAVLVGTNSMNDHHCFVSVEDLENISSPQRVTADVLGAPLGEWP